MSVEPLSREEREARVEDAAREELTHAAISHSTYAYAVRRWDATVQAAEERAEDWMRRGLAAEDRAEKAGERAERLREELEKIPASGLEVLASWFDAYDDRRNYTGDREVQRDLRRWAATVSSALADDDAARGEE